MNQKWSIAENVVLYIEDNQKIKFGIFHNFETDDKLYVNEDMLEVILHLISGNQMDSFFPHDIPIDVRQMCINKSQDSFFNLESLSYLSQNGLNQGRVKRVITNPALRVISIETTKRCNLKCRHCYVPECLHPKKNESLVAADLWRIIDQIDEIGVMEVQLTGGEFFLLPEATAIIKELQHRMIPCSIFTNATVMPLEVFDHLKCNNRGIIFYVSLDGPQEIHDEFRMVNGSYDCAIQSISRLIDMGCDVRINTSVGRHNIDCMKNFVTFIKNRFGIIHRLVKVEKLGRAKDKDDMVVSDREFAHLVRDCGGSFQFLDGHDKISENDLTTPACGIGSAMMFIDAYGNASLCPTLTQEQNPLLLAGNVKEVTIKDIWENSPVYDRFRSIQCREIEGCKSRDLCKGGCRSRVYISTGDINAPDKSMCCLYGRDNL